MAILCIRFILTAAIAYLLGCANGAIIISKYILRDDVRTHGSGNAGLTNFYRTFGKKSILPVILFDMGKAVAAVIVGALLIGNLGGQVPLLGKLVGAVFCMLGHDFPVMFGFRGGKGVLSGGAIAFALDWRLGLICWGLFLIAVVLTRYVSLGSVLAGTAFAVVMWILYPYPADMVISLACAVLLVWGHRGNIGRLLKGQENKFSFHK